MAMTRSEMMAGIRSEHTLPEVTLRRLLWARGLRYRVQPDLQVARPDLAFPRARVAVFVDGCYWHGCPDDYRRPKTNAEFWAKKLRDNVVRDRKQTHALEARGWKVVRVWEHLLRSDPLSAAHLVERAVRDPGWQPNLQPRVVAVLDAADAGREVRRVEDLRDASLAEEVEIEVRAPLRRRRR